MAKDAKGHGSEARGGSPTPAQSDNAPFVSRFAGRGVNYLDPNDPRGAATRAAHQTGVEQATAPMQRRQYEAIAGAINSFPHPEVKSDLAAHFAGALRGTNPNFNSGKFQKAAMTGDMGKTKHTAPGMTRAHYNVVADAVRNFGNSHPDVKSDLASHFAARLGESNSNFKPGQFTKRAS